MRFLLFFTLLCLIPVSAQATVTLLDKDEWKVLLGGFAETDMISDSSRSLTEVAGNTAVDRPGSSNGDNGRTQFSVRNSRFAFTVLPPVQSNMKVKGYLEFDLLGYDPTVSATAPTNSESSFYTNPSLRVRHAYVNTEKEGCQLLIGQTWTLFGWNPYYVLTTASVPPIAGNVYQRTPQIMFMHTSTWTEDKLQAGLSLERPVERDSNMPNVDAGVRYSLGGRKSGFASSSGDVNGEVLSVALSGTYRSFLMPTPGGGTADTTRLGGGAGALNALIPVIASSDGKDMTNTLSITGEYTQGIGYSDLFSSFTGNLSQLSTAVSPAAPNLDAGLGGFDSSGNFQLVKLQTWNVQGQYHLPEGWNSFITTGYGQLYSFNVGSLLPSTGKVAYDRNDDAFINFFHDFTKQFRMALEFDRFSTHYVDGIMAYDSRYQISAWFRF